MRVQTVSLPRREEGAVAVVVALLAVVLIVITAFTTDFGMAWAQRRALSTGADSAALAVIHEKYLAAKADPTLTCGDLDGTDGKDLAATARAFEQVTANAPFNATDIAVEDVDTTLSCQGVGNLQVTVVVKRKIDSIFGSVVGVSQMHIEAKAVAVLGVETTFTGLSPLALCQLQQAELKSRPGVVQYVPADKVWPPGTQCNPDDTPTGGSGNWGWLDWTATSPGSSISLLAASIRAENGTIRLDPPVEGSTTPTATAYGNTGSLAAASDAMQELVWRADEDPKHSVIYLPVYDSVTGTGTGGSGGPPRLDRGAKYNITGFISVRLCAFGNVTGAHPLLVEPVGCAIPEDTTFPLPDGRSFPTMGNNDMQLEYIAFTPLGDWGVCPLGGCGADPDSLMTRLVE